MQPDRARCPECGGTMETGYMLDRYDAGFTVPSWVAGVPRKNGTA